MSNIFASNIFLSNSLSPKKTRGTNLRKVEQWFLIEEQKHIQARLLWFAIVSHTFVSTDRLEYELYETFLNIFFWCDLPHLAVFIIFVLFLPSSGPSYPSSF